MGFLVCKNVYLKAFTCFQAGITDPPEMSPALIAEKEKQRKFLEQLMDGSKLESYNIVVPVKAELRKYQQVRWSEIQCMFNRHIHLNSDIRGKMTCSCM